MTAAAAGMLTAAAAYGVAALGHLAGHRFSRRWLEWATRVALVVGLVAVTLVLAERWIAVDRAPFKTRQESLLLIVWWMTVMWLVVDRLLRVPLLGAAAAGLLAAGSAYALLAADLEPVYLPPSLQSVWFIPHAVVYLAGYGALALATVAAVATLAAPSARLQLRTWEGDRTIGYDALLHAGVIAGFSLITLGMVLGAVWAKEAWGDYWAWDPKESWALVTWLLYGAYLHLRRSGSWRGRRCAWLAIFSFATVVFTYVGIRLLPVAADTAHVYQ